MRIYLAGPMRGIEQFNFPTFATVTELLRQRGHTVFSPAERDIESGFDPSEMDGHEDLSEHGFDLREALGIDLAFICEHADAVAVLPGWAESSGARAEVAAAWALGVPVYRAHAMLHGFGAQDANRIASTYDIVDSWSYDYDRDFVPDWHSWVPPVDIGESESPDEPHVFVCEDRIDIDGAEMVTSSTGGTKGRKLAEMGAIDPTARLELARVAGFGARKYSRGNYLLGIDWSLSVDALHRHLLAWESGEDMDPESGCLHTAHVAWHALALVAFQIRDIGTDDRCVDEFLDSMRGAS